jgi:hypothetical protein
MDLLLARRGGVDIDAGAHLDPQPPFHLEGDQGLAHGGTRHRQHVCEFALRRKAAAHGIFALVDELSDLIRDLAV